MRRTCCCVRAGTEQLKAMQKRAQSGCLYHPHHICLGSEAEVPSPSRLSRALHPQHWLSEKRRSRSCQERASFKAKWRKQHMQLSLPRAIRAITPQHQQPPVGLPIPSGAGLPGRAWGGGDEVEELSHSLAFYISGNQMLQQVLKTDSVRWSSSSRPSTPQHPYTSNHRSAFSFSSPTSPTQPNSSCPLPALPSPLHKRSVLKFRGQEEEM